MMTHPAPMRVRRAILALATLALALSVPMTVLGHAELDTSDPAAGSTVDAPFAGPIVMTFTEALAKESDADLVGSSGKLPATTAVDGSTMTLTPDTALAEGDYQIQWTSVADDGHIERGVIAFTVVAAATPAPTASPTPSAAASAAASAGPSVVPSASAAPSAAASAGPSPSGSGGSGSSGGDVVLPIIAAVVIVGGLAVFLLRRRDSGSAAS